MHIRDILCPVILLYTPLASLGPLFLFQDSTPLSRAWLVTDVREALSQTGSLIPAGNLMLGVSDILL